jgi:hypothetical protein
MRRKRRRSCVTNAARRASHVAPHAAPLATGTKPRGMGWLTGLEPAAFASTARRSNQLSYSHRRAWRPKRRLSGCAAATLSTRRAARRVDGRRHPPLDADRQTAPSGFAATRAVSLHACVPRAGRSAAPIRAASCTEIERERGRAVIAERMRHLREPGRSPPGRRRTLAARMQPVMKMARPEGIEPPSRGLEGRCLIR